MRGEATRHAHSGVDLVPAHAGTCQLAHVKRLCMLFINARHLIYKQQTTALKRCRAWAKQLLPKITSRMARLTSIVILHSAGHGGREGCGGIIGIPADTLLQNWIPVAPTACKRHYCWLPIQYLGLAYPEECTESGCKKEHKREPATVAMTHGIVKQNTYIAWH